MVAEKSKSSFWYQKNAPISPKFVFILKLNDKLIVAFYEKNESFQQKKSSAVTIYGAYALIWIDCSKCLFQ